LTQRKRNDSRKVAKNAGVTQGRSMFDEGC
jgi:hypothetical protein